MHRPMETRELLETVQMLQIFWNSEIECVMKLKPTTILDEKDVVSMKELTSASGQTVGVQATDAQDAWKSWTAQYMSLMKLREEEVQTGTKDMLWAIHGLTRPLGTTTGEERTTLQGDQGAFGSEAQ